MLPNLTSENIMETMSVYFLIRYITRVQRFDSNLDIGRESRNVMKNA